MKQCENIINDMFEHEMSWPFHKEVDPIALDIPDYYTIIKHPMDLGTVRNYLETGQYVSIYDFAEDVRLVWNNALTYNRPGSDICVMAQTLSQHFEGKLGRAVKLDTTPAVVPVAPVVQPLSDEEKQVLEGRIQELQQELDTSEKELAEIKAERQATNNIVNKSFKPKPRKKKLPAKFQQEMSIAEKTELQMAINNLQPQYLYGVVTIVEEESPELLMHVSDKPGDPADLQATTAEVHINIEQLPIPLLRRLEEYIGDVRKDLTRGQPKPHAPRPVTTHTPYKKERVLSDSSSSSDSSDSDTSDSDDSDSEGKQSL